MAVNAADPEAKELDAAWAAAQNAPAKPKEPRAPAPIDHFAPHGRDDEGTPLAPHGYTADGRVRKTAAGRRPKNEQARVGKPAEPAAAGDGGQGAKPKQPPHNYVPAISETADAAWMVLSVGGKIGPELPLVGKLIPGRKIAAQAAVFKAHREGIIGALQYASQHNATAAKWAARMERGEISWALMFGFMVMPFVVQSATMWQDTEKNPALAKAEMPSLNELAKRNEQDLDEFMSMMAKQFAQASATAEFVAEVTTVAGEMESNGQAD
jgi:hypothetical protein